MQFVNKIDKLFYQTMLSISSSFLMKEKFIGFIKILCWHDKTTKKHKVVYVIIVLCE